MQAREYASIPVAIVGAACRLPGADNLDEFWNMLLAGKSACGPVPEERFNRRLYYDPRKGVVGKSYTDLAALVDYSRLRPEITGLSSKDIRESDLAHLAFCQTAVEAVLSSGRNRDALQGRNIGVFVGHAAGSPLSADLTFGIHFPQQAELLLETEIPGLTVAQKERLARDLIADVRARFPRRTADFNPDLSAGQIASLTAKALGLVGPTQTFNSACASSLQALASAVRSIQLGRVEGAIAGGASYFASDTLVLFSAARSLTATGSRPFAADADGLVVGEGSVAVCLKRLDLAIRDGDPIWGVVSAIGLSSDGAGKSLWAPRKEGQIEAINRAYENGTDKSKLQCVEGHSTSTRLGDATELAALQVAFGDALAGRKIPIASVKRNIGHTLEVAGAAGLVKLLLQLKRETIPATIARDASLNPDVDWSSSSFVPTTEAIAWKKNGIFPRRGAVDAFGIGGLNGHAVIDGFDVSDPVALREIYPGLEFCSKQTRGERVAIVGVGAILPGANDPDAFKTALFEKKDRRRAVPKERWDAELFASSTRTGGEPVAMPGAASVDFVYDWRRHKIPPKQLQQGSPLQFMALEAVDRALGGVKKPVGSERTGCVMGTMFVGDFGTQLTLGLRLPLVLELARPKLRALGLSDEAIAVFEANFSKKTFERFPALLDETGSFTASALASRITKSFDLMGGGVALDSGYESFHAALTACVDLLAAGDVERAICVSGQQDLSVENFEMTALGGRLAPDASAPSPLDADARGILPGEGCVAFALKRLDDAKRDGDAIYGIVQGLGASKPLRENVADAVRAAAARALDDAGILPSDVRAAEFSGIGDAKDDRAALLALSSELTPRSGNVEPEDVVRVGARVGEFGLLGGGSGALAALAALVELETETFAGNFGITRPTREAETGALRAPSDSAALRTCQSQGRLFASVVAGSRTGTHCHLILERAKAVEPIPRRAGLERKMSQHNGSSTTPGVVFYDATQRRLEKMRQQARGGVNRAQVAESSRPVASPAPAAKPKPVAPKPAPVAPPRPVAPVAKPAPKPTAPAASAPSRGELENFLINFVVEQTGYPREVVDLDANLEADLGIDSIKKGQLFGELGEYFDVQPDGTKTLDDFQTLRSVLDFLLDNLGGSSAP
ncbi:MAG: hypothetical protein IJM30_11680, partial [Thermoguttaceae bacterium]|nr:hypothetical protein [Thermoguttaceae bacterium]